MATQVLDRPATEEIVDINLDVDVDDIPMEMIDQVRLTSISLCTPGCTSPGGGSGCSWCC